MIYVYTLYMIWYNILHLCGPFPPCSCLLNHWCIQLFDHWLASKMQLLASHHSALHSRPWGRETDKEREKESTRRAQDERFVWASSCINIWDGLCSKYLPPNGKHIWVLPGHVRSIESCFRNLSDLFAAGRRLPRPCRGHKTNPKSIPKYTHTHSHTCTLCIYKKNPSRTRKKSFLIYLSVEREMKNCTSNEITFFVAIISATDADMEGDREGEGEARGRGLWSGDYACRCSVNICTVLMSTWART